MPWVGLALGFALGAVGAIAACGNGDDDDAGAGDGGTSDGTVDASVDHAAPADAAPLTDAGGADADTDAGPRDAAVDAADAGDPAHKTGQVLLVPGADGGRIARTYDITVPLDCATTTTKGPLVIALHGDTQQASTSMNSFGLEEAAKDAGAEAVFVYPNGTDDVGPTQNAWNLYDDPGPFPYAPATLRATTTSTTSTRWSPPSSSFPAWTTGSSSPPELRRVHGKPAGALAIGARQRRRPDVRRGPHGKQGSDYPSGACPGLTGSVPAFIVHGAADMVLTPDNGNRRRRTGTSPTNVRARRPTASTTWKTAACPGSRSPPATPTTATTPSPCVASSGCTAAPVTFCLVEGLSHEIWPGAGSGIWSFIAATRPDGGS